MKSHDELLVELQELIDRGGEVAKVARKIKARIGDDRDATGVLDTEIRNMKRYFGGEAKR